MGRSQVIPLLFQLLLAGIADQSYLCVTPNERVKDMVNQQDMTETAKAVLNALSDKPAKDCTEYASDARTLPVNTDAACDGGVI